MPDKGVKVISHEGMFNRPFTSMNDCGYVPLAMALMIKGKNLCYFDIR